MGSCNVKNHNGEPELSVESGTERPLVRVRPHRHEHGSPEVAGSAVEAAFLRFLRGDRIEDELPANTHWRLIRGRREIAVVPLAI